MAHHKRKGPKSTRAGCLLCKPHKRQGAPVKTRQKFGELRKAAAAGDMIGAALKSDHRRLVKGYMSAYRSAGVAKP